MRPKKHPVVLTTGDVTLFFLGHKLAVEPRRKFEVDPKPLIPEGSGRGERKTVFWPSDNLWGKAILCGFAEQEFCAAPAEFEPGWKMPEKIHDMKVEKRRSKFQRAHPTRTINFRQDVIRQVELGVEFHCFFHHGLRLTPVPKRNGF